MIDFGVFIMMGRTVVEGSHRRKGEKEKGSLAAYLVY